MFGYGINILNAANVKRFSRAKSQVRFIFYACHEKRKKKQDEEIQDLLEMQNSIEKKIKELNSEEEAVRNSLSEAETSLTDIKERISENKSLTALASLLENPQSPLETNVFLKTALGIIEALKTHLTANPQLAFNQKILGPLYEISRNLMWEYKYGARKA